ncbi:hypothetical protein ACZ90_22455 [Streptomyces albus subsp. albus]|nr:hypothetical protein ACZ90_22455 [Streptomyces albus subsp. albus]
MGTGSTVPVADSVREILAVELGIAADSVAGEAEIALLPGMESVKLLKVVSTLEEIHGVSLDDDALFSIETVNDLVKVLEASAPEEAARSAEPGR